MLRALTIRNFVLFEEIEVMFGSGLNVLSGETGGGKSNLAQAMGLLMGGRGRKDQIRSGADHAEVRGIFEVSGATVEIARTIAPNGPGRASIDGRPASIADLRRTCEKLLGITSQHQQISLSDPSEHRRILDEHGDLGEALAAYRASWTRCQEIAQALARLRSAQADRDYREEFLRHHVKEIKAARPTPGEDEGLSREIDILKNAEKIRSALSSAVGLLHDDEGSAVERVGKALRDVERIAHVVTDLSDPAHSLAEASALISDASRTLSSLLERVDIDPAALEAKQERAYALDRLKKKHGGTIEDVIAKLASMEAELETLGSLEDRVRETSRDLDSETSRARNLAGKLTRARRRASTGLARAVLSELRRLAFGAVEFEVEVSPRPGVHLDGLDESGADDVRFLFKPNVGEPLSPLDEIASGGELSRVFLAVRSVLGRRDTGETLVFDEVDTGIGGKVAHALGLMLRDLGERQQVICITHLAQIAAHADTHIVVEKAVAGGRTRSAARILDDGARREEIARMLGGEKITDTSREAASEMLRLARKRGRP